MAHHRMEEVNEMTGESFSSLFANVIECFPQAAVDIAQIRPFESVTELIEEFQKYLENLSNDGKENILVLHPDLAGRLADEGKLTEESLKEQMSAGLNVLSADNKLKLKDLNARYKEKFGFPFVICARENKAASILAGLETRLGNDRDQELTTGINEVKKICRLRILGIVSE